MALDLWICNQFKVLPTDASFKALGEEQKYLLFTGYLEQPLPTDIHRAYQQRNTVGLSDETAIGLSKAGYTAEQLHRIRHELEKAGL